MQILTQLYYLLRSIFLRGLLATVRLSIGENRREEALKIRTRGFLHSGSAINFHYQPAAYVTLDKIFSALLAYRHSHRFVDIGCGRGRVLAEAIRWGFNDLVGIELNSELIRDAEINVRNAANSMGLVVSVSLLNSNASEVEYNPKRSVYFFFNPFNKDVMKVVLARILAVSEPGSVFVYMNPVFREVFQGGEFKVLGAIRTNFYLEAVIYECR